jgi:hypothetical protein
MNARIYKQILTQAPNVPLPNVFNSFGVPYRYLVTLDISVLYGTVPYTIFMTLRKIEILTKTKHL